MPFPSRSSVATTMRYAGFVLGVAIAFATLTLLVASLAPGHSVRQEGAGFAWGNYGSWIVLASLAGLALSLPLAPNGACRIAGGLVACVALAGSVTQVGRIAAAASANGGRVDPLAALDLSSPARPEADGWLTYNAVDGRAMRIGVWKPRLPERNAPVLYLVHRGGWNDGMGDARSSGAEADWWRNRGYLVFSVEYRLASAAYATWDKAPADVACGLGWVAQHASDLGGDPKRIVVLGASAGGNLALNLGYQASMGQARPSCGVSVPVPAAVVAYVPIVDPQYVYDHGQAVGGRETKALVENYIGGRPDRHADRMRAISTDTYLSRDAPRTLVVEPEEDGYVPAESVFRFCDRARTAGVNVTTVRMPVYNHFSSYGNSLAGQANRSVSHAWLSRFL